MKYYAMFLVSLFFCVAMIWIMRGEGFRWSTFFIFLLNANGARLSATAYLKQK